MKRYLFAIVFLSFTTIVMSQDIRYGIRGGFNISNLDFDPDAPVENQHRNGFAFGGFVDFGFTEEVSIMTELQWSAEGGKDETLRADYIKLPILLRVATSQRLTLGVGPQLALKTWQDKDGFSTFTFSGVVGVEYMITDDLFIDTRLTYGFTNILDQDLTDVKAKNHLIQFGFGMKL
jgi:opacity protein-like surface antigen